MAGDNNLVAIAAQSLASVVPLETEPAGEAAHLSNLICFFIYLFFLLITLENILLIFRLIPRLLTLNTLIY